MRDCVGKERGAGRLIAYGLAMVLVGGCSEWGTDLGGSPYTPETAGLRLSCTASVHAPSVRCGALGNTPGQAIVIGGQGQNILLSSTNVSYDAGTEIFSFDVAVQNLLNEAIGTPDGTTPDPEGIQVFFHTGPTATSGSGMITVANPDGVGAFTAIDQPYFTYNDVLAKNQVSSVKTWQLNVPSR